MKVEAPCRLGERFTCEKPYAQGRFVLTGVDFFRWESRMSPDSVLCGKKDPYAHLEHTSFFDPGDAVEGVRIVLELPDEMVEPGFPLRRLGMDTDAVGRLRSAAWTPEGWTFGISYGKTYGGPMENVRTEVLDKLLEPLLPRPAVQVDWRRYLDAKEKGT